MSMSMPMRPAAAGDTPPMAMPAAMGMAFSWGHRVEVLFPGWPGDRAGVGVYLLCLLVVLALAALVEALSAASRVLSSGSSQSPRQRRQQLPAALLAAGVHAAKMGLAYVVMLAVMSFNAGVLLAAVAGHAVGFLLARSGVLGFRATNGALSSSESKP
ncbi:hypothetical protein ABZP36_005875 [Zizania latifolia]